MFGDKPREARLRWSRHVQKDADDGATRQEMEMERKTRNEISKVSWCEGRGCREYD